MAQGRWGREGNEASNAGLARTVGDSLCGLEHRREPLAQLEEKDEVLHRQRDHFIVLGGETAAERAHVAVEQLELRRVGDIELRLLVRLEQQKQPKLH